MKNFKPLIGWYNFQTQEHDYLDKAPDDLTPYMSQHPIVQGLYQAHLALGTPPLEAYIATLKAVVGEIDEPTDDPAV